MSRQLAISSALSVMAMAALVLFGTAPSPEGAFAAPRVSLPTPQLPGIAHILTGN